MRLSFAQEQLVQETISIIQKTLHVSILEINESVIRQCVARGQRPSEIVTALCRFTKES